MDGGDSAWSAFPSFGGLPTRQDENNTTRELDGREIVAIHPREGETNFGVRSRSTSGIRRDTDLGLQQTCGNYTALPAHSGRTDEIHPLHQEAASSEEQNTRNPSTNMPPSGETKSARVSKRLRKKHAAMSKYRDEVSFGREELQAERQNLSFEEQEMRNSQEEFMGLLKEELAKLDLHDRIPYLDCIWDNVQRDAATFHARLERVEGLSRNMTGPEARLVIAEEDFVSAAEKALSMKQVDHEPAMREELRERRRDVSMYRERRNELEWEQDEDALRRDLDTDQGIPLEIPEEDFVHSYISAGDQINRDLLEAIASVAELEVRCRNEGLDTTSWSNTDSADSFGSQSAADGQGEEDGTLFYEDTASAVEPYPGLSTRDTIPWSVASVAGSDPRPRTIDDWIQETDRRASGSDLTDIQTQQPDGPDEPIRRSTGSGDSDLSPNAGGKEISKLAKEE